MLEQEVGNFVVQQSDLLISLACRLNIRQISYNYKSFAKNAYKIIIDIDKAELEKPTVSPDLAINANVKDVINALLKTDYNANNKNHIYWLNWCRDINNKYPVVLPEYYNKASPINPYVFMKELFDCLEENEKVITGNGSACVISFQSAKIKKGQRLYTNSGCAAMGYGLPAALGAAIATKDERIICLDGDGSIQMNIQELATISYNKLNIKIFILNNKGYHSIRQTQNNLFKPPLVGINKENGIWFPDNEKLAIAYSLNYKKIESIVNIKDRINEVIHLNGPVLCEVILDDNQRFEPKLSSKVLEDGTILSPEIDDMYPFVNKEEYEKIKRIGEEL